MAIDAQRAYLMRIWSALPTGPLGEEELNSSILQAAGIYEGDNAAASALRSSLLLAQALTSRIGESGERQYVRSAEFPDWPDNGPGTDAFNSQIEAAAAAEREMVEAASRVLYEGSPIARERQEMLALIDERVERKFDELLRKMDKEGMRERLAALRAA
jgi:hypothetical protein